MEKTHRFSSYNFLLATLTVSCTVVYFVAKPFLSPLILAAVFAYLFQPIYKNFIRFFKESESLAAFITTLIIIILIMIPLIFLGIRIFKESSQLYQSLTIQSEGSPSESIETIIEKIFSFFLIPQNLKLNLGQYAKQGVEILVQKLGAVFSGLAKTLFNIFVFLIAFYYFLKDGHKLKNYLITLSPLDDKDDELIVSRLKQSVSAAIKGNLTIGLIQGILTGIGFAIFGVPNAVLWGGVAAITALLPGIGTALVIIPAIAFLFLIGNIFNGIGLIIWGVIAVGLIDNFLGPKLIGRGMQLHPLIVFISVIGGISLFGPLGFLLGPLSMSVCVALIDIYFSLKNKNSQIL